MADNSSLPRDLATEIGVEDLYEFLGVSSASTDKEITRGYRKKALKYHPDKNPDNPKAADLFQKLSKAYNILTDPAAKGAYDKWLRAKQAAKVRHEELNAKRRKLKESLESRESRFSSATGGCMDEREAAKKMQQEIQRLREEGFQKMQEQTEILRRQFQQAPPTDDSDDLLPTLKVTWRAQTKDTTNGGYSQESLTDLFSQYSPVHHVLVSHKKRGKALVSFDHSTAALCALESGIGLPDNPLNVTWVGQKPSMPERSKPSGNVRTAPSADDISGSGRSDISGGVRSDISGGVRSNISGGVRSMDSDSDVDYESLTLMRLRQAEERKRLNQQLLQEEPS